MGTIMGMTTPTRTPKTTTMITRTTTITTTSMRTVTITRRTTGTKRSRTDFPSGSRPFRNLPQRLPTQAVRSL